MSIEGGGNGGNERFPKPKYPTGTRLVIDNAELFLMMYADAQADIPYIVLKTEYDQDDEKYYSTIAPADFISFSEGKYQATLDQTDLEKSMRDNAKQYLLPEDILKLNPVQE